VLAGLANDAGAQGKPAAVRDKKPAADPEKKPGPDPVSSANPGAERKARPDPDDYRTAVESLERERQQQALAELERLRGRRQEIEVRAQYARQWVLSHYEFDMYSMIREPQAQDAKINEYLKQTEADERSGLTGQADPEVVEKYATGELKRRRLEFSPKRMRYNILKQLEAKQVQRDAFLFRLLSRDEATKGAIARGSALNFFLEKLGAPAFDHALYRELTKNKQSLAGPQRPEKLLNQGSEGEYVLDESITRHIRYTRGSTGAKLTGRLNEGPLDLAWPAVLRSDSFGPLTRRIEKARDKALEELKSGKPVSSAAGDELLDAVNSLFRRLTAEKLKNAGNELWRWVLAERFAKILMGGAYRLVEARTVDDVVVETFKAGTIEELLAFMHRHNLRFAEADANGESAYNSIAEMMIRYYADLEALRGAVAEELKLMGGGHEGALMELSLGDPAKAGPPPELGEKAAASVIEDLKEFDKKQKTGKKSTGK
jgi:hypothetical protein